MNKTFKSLADQVSLMSAIRGLTITPNDNAEAYLYDNNYYRMSGYARQFQIDPSANRDNFEPGSSFAEVVRLADLDGRLRALLFEALKLVETVVRSRFAHEAGRSFGDKAFYLQQSYYIPETPELDQHISKMESELRRKNLTTVKRYRSGDDLSQVPIWVAIELVTYGMLSRMVYYFDDPIAAKATAESLSIGWTGFQSSIHAFAVLRNMCAYHSQLWHRRVDITAPMQNKSKRYEPKIGQGSAYATVIALKRFVRAVDKSTTWPARMDALLAIDPVFAEGIYKPAPK